MAKGIGLQQKEMMSEYYEGFQTVPMPVLKTGSLQRTLLRRPEGF